MKQNASGKGNKGLEIFELKKHMTNHHQHVRNAVPTFETTEKCVPVTLSIQQATKRLQERRLAAKNELLMRRLHDIYAEDSAAAWKNGHKIHIKIDRMHDRLVRWKGQVGAESRKRTEAHARVVSREMKQHCAKVTSPYTQGPFLRDYEKSTKAFNAAKNHSYLTALHLFNNNAYDAKVKNGTMAARSEGMRSRGRKSRDKSDDGSTPRFDKPEHRRLTGRVAEYEAKPRPVTAPIGRRRAQGFDPNSKLIKNLYKDIERAKKKKLTDEEEDDEYNTSDEDMCRHQNDTADMDVNLTRGRNRSASPPRRVYEELSDAFGFKKRYFSDDASKSEHHWNRHQCSSPAVLATKKKKEIIPLDDRVCHAISKRKAELRSPIRDWHINEKFAESRRSPSASRRHPDAGGDTADEMDEYYNENRSEAEGADEEQDQEEQGAAAADQYLHNLMASLEQEGDDEAQWTGGYSPFPSFTKDVDSLADASSNQKNQTATGSKAINIDSVDESSTIVTAREAPAVVLHLCGYTLQGVAVESLQGGSRARHRADCVLPIRKELLAECEVNMRCKLSSEDLSDGSIDAAVVEALVRDPYIMSIYDVGYSVTNNELFSKGKKKEHISFNVQDYIKRQQDEIQKLDEDLNHLKNLQISETAADANTSPSGSVFQSTFEAEAIEDGAVTPCTTGVLIELTSGVSLSKDIVGSLYIPMGSLKATILSMRSKTSNALKKKQSKIKPDNNYDDVQTLLRKLSRFSAVGRCTVSGSGEDEMHTDLFMSLVEGLDAAGEALLTSMLVRTFQPILTKVEACAAAALSEEYAMMVHQLVAAADSEKKDVTRRIAADLRKGFIVAEHADIPSGAVQAKAYELSVYNLHTLLKKEESEKT